MVKLLAIGLLVIGAAMVLVSELSGRLHLQWGKIARNVISAIGVIIVVVAFTIIGNI